MKVWRYFQILNDCLQGRRSLYGSLRSRQRRRYVKKLAERHAGQPIAIEVPTGGTLRLLPNSGFFEWYFAGLENYEPDVQALLKQLLKPGCTFIDCGCNVGFFSVMAADLMAGSGQVISVEANPLIVPVLDETLAGAGLKPAVNCALSTTPGSIELWVPEGMETLASLRENNLYAGASVQRLLVPAKTLDAVFHEAYGTKIDLIKIDVEGAELDVIRSGRECLTQFRPIVIAEYSRITWPKFNVTPADAMLLAKQLNYGLARFNDATSRLEPITVQVWDSDYTNLIWVPQ
jgi:FkbM family methyltransferase